MKKDGSMRISVDYRGSNSVTVEDKFPNDDLLDKLKDAQYFSSVDVQQGFHHIKIAEEDVPKTALITHQGLCEYLVLPFGLTDAPACFQRAMNKVFAGLPFIVVYLNTFRISGKVKKST